MSLNGDDLKDLDRWVDAIIPKSKKKDTMARDFADGGWFCCKYM